MRSLLAILFWVFSLTALAATPQYTSSAFTTEADSRGPSFSSTVIGAGWEAGAVVPIPSSGRYSEIRFSGTAGCSTFRLQLYTFSNKPDALVMQTTAAPLSEVVSSVNPRRSTYTLQHTNISLPGTELFFTVRCEDTDDTWAWAGDGRAGWFRSSSRPIWRQASRSPVTTLSLEVSGDLNTTNTELRSYLRGNDALGWPEGAVGVMGSFWHHRADHRPTNPTSQGVVALLHSLSPEFIDVNLAQSFRDELFALNFIEHDENTPRFDYTLRTQANISGLGEDQFFIPDCDVIRVPVPSQGRLDAPALDARIQGNAGLECVDNGDCHLYTINPATGEFIGQWKSYSAGSGNRSGGCTTKYELNEPFDPEFKRNCTTDTAASLPYIAFAVTPAEVKAAYLEGRGLDHAFAFTMNNNFTKPFEFYAPAKHNPLRFTNPGPDGMIYGSHFVLRADFAIPASATPFAQVMLRTAKTHGMIHIDGSFPPQVITTSDYLDDVEWRDPDVQAGPRDLMNSGVTWLDFRLVSEESEIYSQQFDFCSTRSLPSDF